MPAQWGKFETDMWVKWEGIFNIYMSEYHALKISAWRGDGRPARRRRWTHWAHWARRRIPARIYAGTCLDLHRAALVKGSRILRAAV